MALLTDIAHSLESCHRVGIVHGNINPFSVYIRHTVNEEGRIEVVCKLGGFHMAVDIPKGERETMLRGPYGMLPYVAPESSTTRAILCNKSDVYNLGLLMIDMKTG